MKYILFIKKHLVKFLVGFVLFVIILILIKVVNVFIPYNVVSRTYPKSIDINQLPIIDDCSLKVEKINNDIIKGKEVIDRINKNLNILLTFKLKDNFIIGRVRNSMLGIPNGFFCNSWFDVGVKNIKTSEVFKTPIEILKAFKFTENNLSDVGIFIEGDVGVNSTEVLQEFAKSLTSRLCKNDGNYLCITFSPKLPLYKDGEIYLENNKKILYRIYLSYFEDIYIKAAKISITNNGEVNIEEDTLSVYQTGIIY